jgi:hypothetical protein
MGASRITIGLSQTYHITYYGRHKFDFNSFVKYVSSKLIKPNEAILTLNTLLSLPVGPSGRTTRYKRV